MSKTQAQHQRDQHKKQQERIGALRDRADRAEARVAELENWSASQVNAAAYYRDANAKLEAQLSRTELRSTQRGELPAIGSDVWLWNGHDYFGENDWRFQRFRGDGTDAWLQTHRYWKYAQPRPKWVDLPEVPS